MSATKKKKAPTAAEQLKELRETVCDVIGLRVDIDVPYLQRKLRTHVKGLQQTIDAHQKHEKRATEVRHEMQSNLEAFCRSLRRILDQCTHVPGEEVPFCLLPNQHHTDPNSLDALVKRVEFVIRFYAVTASALAEKLARKD